MRFYLKRDITVDYCALLAWHVYTVQIPQELERDMSRHEMAERMLADTGAQSLDAVAESLDALRLAIADALKTQRDDTAAPFELTVGDEHLRTLQGLSLTTRLITE